MRCRSTSIRRHITLLRIICEKCHDMGLQFNPKTILCHLCDFEKAAMNAATVVFRKSCYAMGNASGGEYKLSGWCYFMVCLCSQRMKLKQRSLKTLYQRCHKKNVFRNLPTTSLKPIWTPDATSYQICRLKAPKESPRSQSSHYWLRVISCTFECRIQPNIYLFVETLL